MLTFTAFSLALEMYCNIIFIEENPEEESVATALTSWLEDDDQICVFPALTKYVKRALKNNLSKFDPCIPWEKFPVRKIRGSETSKFRYYYDCFFAPDSCGRLISLRRVCENYIVF